MLGVLVFVLVLSIFIVRRSTDSTNPSTSSAFASTSLRRCENKHKIRAIITCVKHTTAEPSTVLFGQSCPKWMLWAFGHILKSQKQSSATFSQFTRFFSSSWYNQNGGSPANPLIKILKEKMHPIQATNIEERENDEVASPIRDMVPLTQEERGWMDSLMSFTGVLDQTMKDISGWVAQGFRQLHYVILSRVIWTRYCSFTSRELLQFYKQRTIESNIYSNKQETIKCVGLSKKPWKRCTAGSIHG